MFNKIKTNIDEVLEYTPQQLNPENWEKIINNKIRIQN